MNQIIMQTMYYMIVMILSFFIIAFMQRGFFWKFVRVKLSLGRLVLIKVRSVLRDYYKVGWVEEGMLKFMDKREKKKFTNRTTIQDPKVFYRSMGIFWVDYDEQTGGLAKTDYSALEGHDAAKEDEIVQRSIYAPVIGDKKEQLMLVILIILCIVVGVVAYFSYKNLNEIGLLRQSMQTLASSIKPIPTPAAI